LEVYSSTFTYNYATYGGATLINHGSLNYYEEKNEYTSQTATTGGVFMIGTVQTFTMERSDCIENIAKKGTIIFATSTNSTYDISYSIFQGDIAYNYTKVYYNLVNGLSVQASPFVFISDKTSTITFLMNEFKYF
jgi:hypothetical protein